MFTIRTLDTNEYDKLKSIPDMPDADFYTPDNSIVLVMSNGNDEIVGRVALINLIHVEGAWLKDSSWNVNYGFQLAKLEEAILAKAKELGLSYVHTYAPSAIHEDLLQRLGWERLPLSVWAKKTGE